MGQGISNMADIKAVERVPYARRDLPVGTYAALKQGAEKNPNKIALRFFLHGGAYADQIFFTYEDVIGLVNQAANMFVNLGIGQDDVVSTILPNIPQALFTLWGGETAGIVNPIDPRLDPEVLASILNAAGSKVLVTMGPIPGSDLWDRVASIVDRVESLETILQVDIAHYLSRTERWATRYVRFRSGKGPAVRARVLDFGQAAYQFPAESFEGPRAIVAEDTAALYYCGTGTKLARLTHENKVYSAWSLSEMIAMSSDKEVFSGRPLADLPEAIFAGLMPFMNGATLTLGSPGTLSDAVIQHFWQIIAHYGINLLSVDPADFRAITEVPIETAGIESLESALIAAAVVSPQVLRQFEEMTSARVLESYGVTEGGGYSSINPAAGARKAGSAGLRIPYQEMKSIILDNSGAYLGDSEIDHRGAIIIRGPNVFDGYLDEVQDPARWLDTGDAKGSWLVTENSGRVDGQGFFWIESEPS